MEPPEGGGKRPRKGAAASAGTVEMASVDDLLREIFVRLPDTSSLARAALACKRWRLVASHPSFLRRFHSLHPPPPLLGFIMCEPPPKVFYPTGANRSFVRVASRIRNPHIGAAAAAADLDLEDFIANNPSPGYEWVLRACDGGLLLLTYGFIEREKVAVYDPIARAAVFLRRPHESQVRLDSFSLHYALVAGDDGAFRVFVAQFAWDCVMGAVFDSRTGEWAALPTLEDVPHPWNMRGGMHAGRFAYWQSNIKLRSSYSHEPERALVLDTITMEWTLIQVPFPAKESYCVADMPEYGGLCLVASKEQTVQLWARDNNGWVIKKTVSLLKEFQPLKRLRREWMKRVRILEARDGYIYMEFWSLLKPNSYLLVLNWETMQLWVHANYSTEKFRGPAFPFFMTWAPPLLSPAAVRALGLQGV